MRKPWKEPELNVITKEDFSKIILANARSGLCGGAGGGGGGGCEYYSCMSDCGFVNAICPKLS